MTSRRTFLAVAVLAAACSSASSKPLTVAEMPAINTDAVLADIKVLASDEFEGRLPGSKGEERTVAYLVDRFKGAGLEPGNPDGTYTQKVPLVGLTHGRPAPLVVTKARGRRPSSGATRSWRGPSTSHQTAGSQLGFGLRRLRRAGARSIGWDDYKGLDVKGKTLVMLVNDPPVPDPSNPASWIRRCSVARR